MDTCDGRYKVLRHPEIVHAEGYDRCPCCTLAEQLEELKELDSDKAFTIVQLQEQVRALENEVDRLST